MYQVLQEPLQLENHGRDSTSTGFPRIKAANLSDLVQNEPVQFNYPLEETPNILVKLGTKAEGGIGPDGDIVVFSMICQHLGCICGFVSEGQKPSCNPIYAAKGPVGYCCCNGSIFDFEFGKVLWEGRPKEQFPR